MTERPQPVLRSPEDRLYIAGNPENVSARPEGGVTD